MTDSTPDSAIGAPLDAAMDAGLDQLASFLRGHRRVLLLTGAGLSTGSGIPDYRDKDGVRRGNAPIQGPEFRRSEPLRRRYWARSMVGYPTLALAGPNPGHLALAELERRGLLAATITQNVDGLHQRAGSAQVIELHGNIHQVACLDCGARSPRAAMQVRLEQSNPALLGTTAAAAPDGDALLEPASLEQFQVPACPACGGVLTPDVVFFGDNVPRPVAEAADQALAAADALLVVGSSLVVFSGYRFCKAAAASGKPVAALNLGKMRADALLSLKVELAAERALPALLSRLQS